MENLTEAVETVNNNWSEQLDSLEVGGYFLFGNKYKTSVSSRISSHFHELTNKRFKVEKISNGPNGQRKATRLSDAPTIN